MGETFWSKVDSVVAKADKLQKLHTYPSQRQLAEAVGVDQPTLSRYRKIAGWPREVRDYVQENGISRRRVLGAASAQPESAKIIQALSIGTQRRAQPAAKPSAAKKRNTPMGDVIDIVSGSQKWTEIKGEVSSSLEALLEQNTDLKATLEALAQSHHVLESKIAILEASASRIASAPPSPDAAPQEAVRAPISWGHFARVLGRPDITAQILGVVFLCGLLTFFGVGAFTASGFSAWEGLARSLACEAMAVIVGGVLAGSRTIPGKISSWVLLVGCLGSFCYFAWASAQAGETRKAENRAASAETVKIAESEYDHAKQAYSRELESINFLPPDYVSAREKRLPFLESLKITQENKLQKLEMARLNAKSPVNDGLIVIEIALRVIGTLVLAMLVHGIVGEFRSKT